MKRILLSIMLGASIVSNVSPMKRMLIADSEHAEQDKRPRLQAQNTFDLLGLLPINEAFVVVACNLDGKSFSALTQTCHGIKNFCETIPANNFLFINFPDAACHGNANLTRQFLALPQNKFFDPTAAEPIVTGHDGNGETAYLFRNDFRQAKIHPIIDTITLCSDNHMHSHFYIGSVYETKSKAGVLMYLSAKHFESQIHNSIGNGLNLLLNSRPDLEESSEFCELKKLWPYVNMMQNIPNAHTPISFCEKDGILLLSVCMHDEQTKQFGVSTNIIEPKNPTMSCFEYMCINVMFFNAALKNFFGVVDVLLNNEQALTCLSNEALEAALGITESDEIKQLVNSVIKARQA